MNLVEIVERGGALHAASPAPAFRIDSS